MNKAMIIGVDSEGFQVMSRERPTREVVALTHAHKERLTALLNIPALLCVTWDDGDSEARVIVMPVEESDPNKEFDHFVLPFWPRH
jgi:hypothetical protein